MYVCDGLHIQEMVYMYRGWLKHSGDGLYIQGMAYTNDGLYIRDGLCLQEMAYM